MKRFNPARAPLGAAMFGAALLLFASLAANVASQPADQYAYHAASAAGRQMTAEQAAEKEAKLESNPNNLSVRAALLGYYGRGGRVPGGRKEVEKHVVWLVEKKPESSLSAEHHIDLHFNRAAFGKCLVLFEAHLARDPENIAIIANYASFVSIHDHDLALDLLRKGAALEPDNPYWLEQIAHASRRRASSLAYQITAAREHPILGIDEAEAIRASKEAAREALAACETVFALAGDGIGGRRASQEAAEAAYEAEEYEKARIYARRVLASNAASALSGPPGLHGARHADNDAVHAGNTILGLLAMRDGDMEAARNHLVASAPDGGSPVLGSFGPSMRLAAAMLEAGERDAVLRYFERCGKFWKMGREDLATWTEDVKAGGTPSDKTGRWRRSISR
jgi:hypothetical protein